MKATNSSKEDLLPRYVYGSATPTGGVTPYLPIEYFRDHALIQRLFCGPCNPRHTAYEARFLSSGTTASTRAQSLFSKAGLASYRRTSVEIFLETLKLKIPQDRPLDLKTMKGVSLVPSTHEWPDSSLAQMVAWIGEQIPVTYVKPEDLHDTISQLTLATDGAPCWVFGTAFHFVQIADAGLPLTPLPTGSIVYETGGTKGKSRSVSQEELHVMIMERFHVPRSHIISEYGMSELACQAYSVDTPGDSAHHTQWFRFPPWVQPSVMIGPGVCARAGRGLLLVADPERLDFPWPIRTEDLVDLLPTGLFRLLGRAVQAPLKGCSLQVEHALAPMGGRNPMEAPPKALYKTKVKTVFLERVHHLNNFLKNCNRQAFLKALTTEFGSGAAARLCWEDLFGGFPTPDYTEDEDKDEDENEDAPKTLKLWSDIARQAFGKDALQHFSIDDMPSQHWLFLLPENHSVVGVYPLLLAYLCGLQVTVRLPRAFAHREAFLPLFIEDCASLLPGFMLSCLPPTFRVQPPLEISDRILVYGSDATIDTLKSWYPGSVQGFGHSWAMTVVLKTELLGLAQDSSETRSSDGDIIGKIFRDFLSLDQSGCRSSRFLLVLDTEAPLTPQQTQSLASPLERFSRYLTEASEDSLAGSLLKAGRQVQTPRAYSLELEACRLHRLGFQVSADGLLLAQKISRESAEKPQGLIDFGSMVSQTNGTVPIMEVDALEPKDLRAVGESLFAQSHLTQIGFSPAARHLLDPHFEVLKDHFDQKPPFARLALGDGNKQLWNGLHQDRPLWAGF